MITEGGDRYFVPPLGQISSSWYDKLPPNPLSEIGQLLDLINAAQHIHTNDYGRWGPSSDTEISQLRNVDNRDHTPNDIQAQKGGIEIISGANMSGKTTYLRSLYANHALAASTGWVPAEAMSSPLYERILYVDRPQHDTQKGLSSFGMDIKYWKEITNMLRDAAPSLIVIDEPFSTTSDDYQENLMLATLEWLAQRGHRVVVATHNHNAIKRLEDTGSQEQDGVASITFRHFGTHITESGDVHFTRDLLPGTGESYGLAVARMLGGEAFRQLSS
jgi:DNA mismatch repair ATPase MutS